VWANHGEMASLQDDVDDLELPSFFFSVIREPVSRCFSQFYHIHIDSQFEKGPPYMEFGNSSEAKIKYMKTRCANYQYEYLKREEHSSVDDVWNYYALIGTGPERLEETAVMLADKFGHGSELTDVMYIDAKLEDSLQKREPERWVKHIALEEEPQEVQDYANGQFIEDCAADFELYRRANEAIDEYVDDKEQSKVVNSFKDLQAKLAAECGQVEYCPGGLIGQCKGCIWKDAGCGYACADAMMGLENDWGDIDEKKTLGATKDDSDDGDSNSSYNSSYKLNSIAISSVGDGA